MSRVPGGWLCGWHNTNGRKRMCFGPECEKPVEWARTAQQAVGLDGDCICEEQKIPVRCPVHRVKMPCAPA